MAAGATVTPACRNDGWWHDAARGIPDAAKHDVRRARRLDGWKSALTCTQHDAGCERAAGTSLMRWEEGMRRPDGHQRSWREKRLPG